MWCIYCCDDEVINWVGIVVDFAVASGDEDEDVKPFSTIGIFNDIRSAACSGGEIVDNFVNDVDIRGSLGFFSCCWFEITGWWFCGIDILWPWYTTGRHEKEMVLWVGIVEILITAEWGSGTLWILMGCVKDLRTLW